MSFTRIHCNGCGKSGLFFLELKMTYHWSDCPCCHEHSSRDNSYYFCGLECLKKWQDYHEVFDKGISCPDCVDYKTGKSCGFSHGFESNGQCKTCEGTGRLKEMRKEKRQYNAEHIALNEAFQKMIEEAGGYEAYAAKKAKEQKIAKAKTKK